jgi:RimJ/RimL family protein N-acetyltransferase
VNVDRLELATPVADDVEDLYAICSDPRVWTHLPSARHVERSATQHLIDGWIAEWGRDGLGPWSVREDTAGPVVGYGGCSVRHDAFWNLGYRFSADHQGRGYATEVSLRGMEAARAHRPELPIVAYLLEHNTASARVAEKVGLRLVHRGPDAGNPDADAIRLIYADRALDKAALAATLK